MNAPQLIGKRALIERAHAEHARLDDAIAPMSEAQACAPVLEGGRSAKDVLAHIAAWERRVITAIAIGRTGETPPWPEPGFNPWDTDKLNERDFQANRERALAEVISEARVAHDEFMELVESFSEEEIANDLPYTPGIKLEQILRGHADEHYQHHREAIEAASGGGAL
jgi:hypothetical protein